MNSTFKIGLAPALVLLPALLAKAAQTCCEARVSERLDRLNVSPSDIRRVFYEAQRHIGPAGAGSMHLPTRLRLHALQLLHGPQYPPPDRAPVQVARL